MNKDRIVGDTKLQIDDKVESKLQNVAGSVKDALAP